jgi:hypothetical protein
MLVKFVAQKGLAQLWEAATSRPCQHQDEDTGRRCGAFTRYRIRCDRSANEGAALCEVHLPDWAQQIISVWKSALNCALSLVPIKKPL